MKPTSNFSLSSYAPSPAPSAPSSSASHKQSRNVSTDVTTRISEASDTIVCQIQETTKANTETKRLRIQAQIVSKELRSRDGHAQCEHELKQQMLMQEHEWSMANEKVRLLELELCLEETKLHRLGAQMQADQAGEK